MKIRRYRYVVTPPLAFASLLAVASASIVAERSPSPPQVTFLPFAPGSTDLTAGKGGFVLSGGSFPNEMLGRGVEGSHGLAVSGGPGDSVIRTPPVEYRVSVVTRRFLTEPSTWWHPVDVYEPSPIAIPHGSTVIRLTMANHGSQAHRLGATVFQTGAICVLEGKGITVPPPVTGYPTVVVTEGSVINIANERVYKRFYVEIPTGATASLTFDVSQYTELDVIKRDRAIELSCGLAGHNERLLLALQ